MGEHQPCCEQLQEAGILLTEFLGLVMFKVDDTYHALAIFYRYDEFRRHLSDGGQVPWLLPRARNNFGLAGSHHISDQTVIATPASLVSFGKPMARPEFQIAAGNFLPEQTTDSSLDNRDDHAQEPVAEGRKVDNFEICHKDRVELPQRIQFGLPAEHSFLNQIPVPVHLNNLGNRVRDRLNLAPLSRREVPSASIVDKQQA